MRLKIDLHIHTRNSIDSFNSLNMIVKYARKRNISVIGITDHNVLTSMEDQEGIRFIIGEEIKTKSGELIGFFLNETIKKGFSLLDTIKEIKRQGGIVCVPHPLDRLRRSAIGYDNLMKVIDYVDIIEVFNGRTLVMEDNFEALKIARRFKKGMSCGSDAHIPFEIGVCSLEIEDFKTKDDFLNVLKNPKINIGKSPFLVHIPSTFAKYYNRIKRIYQNI